jgi:hypothetical protein
MLHIAGVHLLLEKYAECIEQCDVLEALTQAKHTSAPSTLVARAYHRKGKALFALQHYPEAYKVSVGRQEFDREFKSSRVRERECV